jgi:hypothetical protein
MLMVHAERLSCWPTGYGAVVSVQELRTKKAAKPTDPARSAALAVQSVAGERNTPVLPKEVLPLA